jgi:hypothetical protein
MKENSKKVADIANITEITIRNVYKELVEYFEINIKLHANKIDKKELKTTIIINGS